MFANYYIYKPSQTTNKIKAYKMDTSQQIMKNWQDIYKLPLIKSEYGSWVYDSNNNFVFQFQIRNEEARDKILEIINGDREPTKDNKVEYQEGHILSNGKELILIRGWGNLTGVGGHNLPAQDAANIQDTFADYIVDKLTL